MLYSVQCTGCNVLDNVLHLNLNIFVLKNWTFSPEDNKTTQVTILRKIRGNSQESFTGKSGENVDSFSQEFLVTNSEEPGPRNFL